jgi:WD40 repeat protein
MTGDRRIEQLLPVILEDIGTGPAPDYTDAILRRTAVTPQHPGWVSLAWWPPMERMKERVAVTRLPLRMVAVIVLILMAVTAGVALISKAPPRPLPPPFGPAGNGLIAFAWAGRDIQLGDPATGTTQVITTGPETDTAPRFSPNGAKLLFLRSPGGPSTTASVMVANADGSDLRQLTDQPLQEISGVDWSGDGRSIVVISRRSEVPAMTVIDVETGSARVLDVGMAVMAAVFRPPDGDELLFVGEADGVRKLYAIQRDGTDQRLVGPEGCETPAWSPDGKLIVYSKFDVASGRVFLHTVGADGRGDVTLGSPSGVIREDEPLWSPDGGFFLVLRSYWEGSGIVPVGTQGDEIRMAVIDLDGTFADREFPVGDVDLGAVRGFSPDGTKIVSAGSTGFVVTDIVTRSERHYDGWFSASWQRVAVTR